VICNSCSSRCFLLVSFVFSILANSQQTKIENSSNGRTSEIVRSIVLRDKLNLPSVTNKPGPPRVRPILTHVLASGLWRTDGGFVANIRLKNALVAATLEVSPVLYMADGTEYRLAPVNIPPAGIAVVNINEALAKAPPSVLTHLSSFGSAALSYRHPSSGHLVATIALQDSSRSLSLMYPFSDATMPGQPASGAQSWEGVWWKHDADVDGFLAISNGTNTDVHATVRLMSANGASSQPEEVILPSHSTHMFPLENESDRSPERRLGGVRVEYYGEAGSVLVAGGLLNPKEGYSANIPFMRHTDVGTGPVILGSAGLMVGKPDPMMQFPGETRFTPYLVLRNTTAKPIDMALQFSHMTETTPVSRVIQQNLPALGSKTINLPNVLGSLGMQELSGSINVGVSYTGRVGDVVMAAGSVDQSGTYVFEVEPQALSSTHRKLGSYWDLTDSSNTMYSIWNPTDKPQDVLVTLYYGDNGKYKMPVHVVPQGSLMLDVKNIVKANAPDPSGNVFPPGTSEGSTSFESAEGPAGQINVIISGAVFNVVTGTCTNCCVPCCGTSDVFLNPGSDACTVGATEQFQAISEQCDGTELDETTGGSWSSSNAAVATVSSGFMTAVGPGSATLFFTANLPASSDCGQPLAGECPMQNFQDKAQVTDGPQITGISPSLGLVGTATPVTITGKGFTGATVSAAQGANIGVSNVNVVDDMHIKVTLTPTNSTAGGGNQAIVVTANQQPASTNFFGQIPTSLTIPPANQPVVIADGAPAGCTAGQNIGIKIDITYQVLDQNSRPIQSSNMAAWEDDTTQGRPASGWTCPSQAPDCTRNTQTDGTYHDAPVGICLFSSQTNIPVQQIISMFVGNSKYTVRTNNFVEGGTSPGHGSITNNGDINVSR